MAIDNIKELSLALLPEMILWRREIHQNPELSFQEQSTGTFVCSILQQHGISFSRVATNGVLAIINGTEPDPTHPMVLRADMDALPINELSGVEWASTNGLMHACGHDMHTAGLLGALVLLEQNRQRWHGTVWGLFQPAEEMHPGGASVVIGEGTFKGVEPRFFLGAHCSPELETGVIGLCQGQFMASTDEIHMTIHGVGGHGAMPHQLQDTVLAQAAVVMALQQVVSRRCNAFIPTVLSFGKVVAAGATNIIPSEVYMEGTFRTMDEQWRAQAKEVITQVACSTALAYGCTAQVDIRDGYPSVINDPSLTQQAMAVAEKLFGKTGVQIIPKRMTAEDFGFYAARYKALFFRLGTGGGAPLHNAAFCPNEQALAYGAAMMAAFVMAQE